MLLCAVPDSNVHNMHGSTATASTGMHLNMHVIMRAVSFIHTYMFTSHTHNISYKGFVVLVAIATSNTAHNSNNNRGRV